MKKIIFLIIIILVSNQAKANNNCFVVSKNNQIIKQKGNCNLRRSPCSTFKIVISLIGYNEGILIDETHPKLPFKTGYVDWLEVWKQPHNPKLWIKNSAVWYSQIITQKLGTQKIKKYLHEFNYGNQNISGDKNQNNGLTNSWLSSSLEISAIEQIQFLQKLINNRLPITPKSYKMTKDILFIEDFVDGWKLYGKTGNGSLLNKDKTKKLEQQIGWFIGWIEKNNNYIVFVNYIEDKHKQTTYASIRAKKAAKKQLEHIIKIANF